MSSSLARRLQALAALPVHIGAPAMGSLQQGLYQAMERFQLHSPQQGLHAAAPAPQELHATAPTEQGLHAIAPALQALYAEMLRLALSLLLGRAVASLAALPIVGHAHGSTQTRSVPEQLLTLLGQVGILHVCTRHFTWLAPKQIARPRDERCANMYWTLPNISCGYHTSSPASIVICHCSGMLHG